MTIGAEALALIDDGLERIDDLAPPIASAGSDSGCDSRVCAVSHPLDRMRGESLHQHVVHATRDRCAGRGATRVRAHHVGVRDRAAGDADRAQRVAAARDDKARTYDRAATHRDRKRHRVGRHHACTDHADLARSDSARDRHDASARVLLDHIHICIGAQHGRRFGGEGRGRRWLRLLVVDHRAERAARVMARRGQLPDRQRPTRCRTSDARRGVALRALSDPKGRARASPSRRCALASARDARRRSTCRCRAG